MCCCKCSLVVLLLILYAVSESQCSVDEAVVDISSVAVSQSSRNVRVIVKMLQAVNGKQTTNYIPVINKAREHQVQSFGDPTVTA